MSGPDHKHGSEDAEAGPSKAPYSPPASVVPPHTEYDEENFESIASSLEARRTERSIYHTLLGKKDKVKSRFEAHRAQRGYPVDDGEEEEEIEEGVQDPVIQEQRRDLRPATHAGIEALEAQDKVDGIVLIKDGEELKSSEEWTHEAVNMALEKPGYVWDVLFENQRGIFLLGKAYFSSRTLLPADPSPFTLPCRSLPSASSFTVSEPSNHLSNESTIRRTKADRSNAHTSQKDKKRSIVTAYTLDTFQTPSPAWKWVTPWMVNMKNGTDEAGWRYNVWFKKTGWRSHAGSLGANGYVRRREWVRLRCLPMEEEKDKSEEVPKATMETSAQDALKHAWESNGSMNELVKIFSSIPLDRLRLEEWDAWLQTFDDADKRRLDETIHSQGSSAHLFKTFTHPSAAAELVELFERHGINTSTQKEMTRKDPAQMRLTPSTPSLPPSPSPETAPSDESSPRTPTSPDLPLLPTANPEITDSPPLPLSPQQDKRSAFPEPYTDG